MKIFVVAMVHLGYARILVLPVGGVRILLDRNSTPTGPAVEIMAGKSKESSRPMCPWMHELEPLARFLTTPSVIAKLLTTVFWNSHNQGYANHMMTFDSSLESSDQDKSNDNCPIFK